MMYVVPPPQPSPAAREREFGRVDTPSPALREGVPP